MLLFPRTSLSVRSRFITPVSPTFKRLNVVNDGHVTDQMKQDSARRMEQFIKKISGQKKSCKG